MARAASDARDALGEAGAVVIHVDCDIDEYAAATGTTVEEVRQYVTDGRFAHILGQTIFLYGPSFEKQPVAIRRQAVYHEYSTPSSAFSRPTVLPAEAWTVPCG